MKKYSHNQSGFVILFSILIATIILMMGLGIFSIATRQTTLSGSAREAQYAFYAADAGVECALYAESKGVFANPNSTFECGGSSIMLRSLTSPFMFYLNIGGVGPSATCAVVNIFDLGTTRRIVSQGYNICDGNGEPARNNPLLVERDLDVTYEITGAAPLISNPLSPLAPVPKAINSSPIISNPLSPTPVAVPGGR